MMVVMMTRVPHNLFCMEGPAAMVARRSSMWRSVKLELWSRARSNVKPVRLLRRTVPIHSLSAKGSGCTQCRVLPASIYPIHISSCRPGREPRANGGFEAWPTVWWLETAWVPHQLSCYCHHRGPNPVIEDIYYAWESVRHKCCVNGFSKTEGWYGLISQIDGWYQHTLPHIGRPWEQRSTSRSFAIQFWQRPPKSDRWLSTWPRTTVQIKMHRSDLPKQIHQSTRPRVKIFRGVFILQARCWSLPDSPAQNCDRLSSAISTDQVGEALEAWPGDTGRPVQQLERSHGQRRTGRL